MSSLREQVDEGRCHDMNLRFTKPRGNWRWKGSQHLRRHTSAFLLQEERVRGERRKEEEKLDQGIGTRYHSKQAVMQHNITGKERSMHHT
jgi:hypothetical protein